VKHPDPIYTVPAMTSHRHHCVYILASGEAVLRKVDHFALSVSNSLTYLFFSESGKALHLLPASRANQTTRREPKVPSGAPLYKEGSFDALKV